MSSESTGSWNKNQQLTEQKGKQWNETVESLKNVSKYK